MPSLVESCSGSFTYAVLRYVSDPQRDISVPAGVVLWGGPDKGMAFRAARASDRVPELANETARVLLRDTVERVQQWVASGKLPYASRQMTPDDAEWWQLAQRLLHHRVRLTAPVPVDCVDPAVELDLLFTAVVSPRLRPSEERRRVDGAIGRALGSELRRRLRRSARTAGYRLHDTTVARLYDTGGRRLVVEGINLAGRQAEEQAHRLVGKARWIRDSGGDVQFVVGYLSSPNGLNGERIFKEWIEERLETRCYDLVRDREVFSEAVRRMIPDQSPLPE